MARLAQRATAALETKLTLASSHLNGFMGHRAKAFSERDSLERVGTRLMTLAKDATRRGGTDYFVPVLSITIFSRSRGKSRAVAARAAPPGQCAKRKRSIDELIMALAS